jgi:hypothetical protein
MLCFSRASVHPVPLPRHIAVEVLWHNCSDAMHRRCVGSSGAEDSALKSPLLASTRPSDRPTLHLDQVSDHPVLKASSWRVSVWIQTERGIDRRCPHSDRSIIRCYCLRCSSSATRPMLLNNGPSVHPTIPRVSPVYQLIRRLHRRLLNWCCRFIRQCLFFSFSCSVLTLCFDILACGFVASLGPRSVCKDILKQYG